MISIRKSSAFTLVEMLISLGLVGVVGAALLMFASTSSRFAARNLATNHSHGTLRTCGQKLLAELRDSATSFRLFDFDGTNFTDATPVASADQDARTGQYASTRSNGVRFRKLAGGPFKLTSNCTASSITMTFDFRTGTTSDYVPKVGDKVVLPLVSREFDITAVSGAASPTATVTIGTPCGFSLDTSGSNFIVGYFYRRVAFSVWNNALRFHDDFTGDNRSNFTVVSSGVTSPKPFSLLFPSASAVVTDALALRLSLEVTDMNYSAQKFGNSTTTLVTVIPPRNQPTVVSSSN